MAIFISFLRELNVASPLREDLYLKERYMFSKFHMKIVKSMLPILTVANLSLAQAEEPKSDTSSAPKAAEPFAFADFTWLNGNSHQKEFPLATKIFTGQFSLDTNFVYSLNQPKDHTLVGSTNSGRTSEFQVQQIGIGGDFNYQNVRGRLMTQFGMYSTMTPRNDASPYLGQWQLHDAYRYISEAYAGYHWDIWNGINLDVGIFMSYIGLCSYYNYENWVYQMSYVSANTPWFFNGMRLQTFPSDKLKIEYWLINGWQSYGMFNEAPGAGASILYRPTGDWAFVSNNYFGQDTFGTPTRTRVHSDNSVQYKYWDQPPSYISKAALSVTLDVGCESGGGVNCNSDKDGNPPQYFIGAMVYNRVWFDKDQHAITLGGGFINNPGRYLVLVPPINGADAKSGAPDYFTANKGDEFRAWDASLTYDYMPNQFITYRVEFNHRQASVPYFAGRGGVTPKGGSNMGGLGSTVTDWTPDLVGTENRINASLMVRL